MDEKDRRRWDPDAGLLPEMARIGFVQDEKCRIEIYVLTDDPVQIPHFHVRAYDSDDTACAHFSTDHILWESCIRYDRAAYLSHGIYRDQLPDKKTAAAIDAFLRRTAGRGSSAILLWHIAADAWNANNEEKIPQDSVQPDYTALETGRIWTIR